MAAREAQPSIRVLDPLHMQSALPARRGKLHAGDTVARARPCYQLHTPDLTRLHRTRLRPARAAMYMPWRAEGDRCVGPSSYVEPPLDDTPRGIAPTALTR